MGTVNSKSRSKTPTDEMDANVELLRSICKRFHFRCRIPMCQENLPVEDIDEHFENWAAGAAAIPPSSQLSSYACDKCAQSTCIGCRAQPSMSQNNGFTPLGVVNHCCELGRLFGIWFILSRFDERELRLQSSDRPHLPSTTSQIFVYDEDSDSYDTDMEMAGVPPKKISNAKKHKNTGVGYGGSHQHWQEYGMFGLYGNNNVKPLQDGDDEKTKDTLTISTLRLLVAFLPADGLAKEELAMFRLSFLFDQVADLIRNDSIADITERRDLYQAVFSFVQALANHPQLSKLLLEGRATKLNSVGIKELGVGTWNKNSFVVRDHLDGLSVSIFNCFENTNRQAKAFLKFDRDSPKSQSSRLCQQICNLYDSLLDSFAKSGMTATINNSAAVDTWKNFADENRVTMTDAVMINHRYTSELSALTATPTKSRLNTIAKEVATMTTSLPPGIFLKVADSRSDVMKVLIVGSEGSPYAGGLFTFDIFLDANYPNSPPKMAFVLDGNDEDSNSFNPNLHRGGTVCLSLLNTWPGDSSQMWQPGQSTILAVLISVQAMILGAPLPWLNEPGYESFEATHSRVVDHKLLVQTKTIRHAMIAWLLDNKFENPKSKDYIWKEICETYWKHNGMKALDYARSWAEENPHIRKFNPLKPVTKKHTTQKGGKGAALKYMGQEINLITQLESFLGVEISANAPSPNRTRNKHKLENAEDAGKGQKTQKQKSSSNATTLDSDLWKWIYTGGNSQKEVRAACKELGIGAARTIKESVQRIEAFIEKGKTSVTLTEKYGTMIPVGGAEPYADYPDDYDGVNEFVDGYDGY